jgi:hypothetical protein
MGAIGQTQQQGKSARGAVSDHATCLLLFTAAPPAVHSSHIDAHLAAGMQGACTHPCQH